MRDYDAATIAYLNARQGTIERKFVYFIGKNRTTGEQEEVGFSNLPYTVTIGVISGKTGVLVNRDYVGAGALLDVDDVDDVSDLTIRQLSINLTQTNSAVNNAIRGYDTRNAWVEYHKGLFKLDTRNLVAPPMPSFSGFLNKSPIKRAKVGSSGGVQVTAVSRVRELTITNPAMKSDEYQQFRFPGDRFRKYSSVAGLWPVSWGEEKAKAKSK